MTTKSTVTRITGSGGDWAIKVTEVTVTSDTNLRRVRVTPFQTWVVFGPVSRK